jgi:hypothetical protein
MMNKKTRKIGWQKYESLLEEQMSSPVVHDLIKNAMKNVMQSSHQFDPDDEDEELESIEEDHDSSIVMPINSKILDDIAIITNFDCWIGHTNFDITNKTKQILDQVEGVEVLKIFSRYRFFIGIGKMFDFKDVRSTIEKELLQE